MVDADFGFGHSGCKRSCTLDHKEEEQYFEELAAVSWLQPGWLYRALNWCKLRFGQETGEAACHPQLTYDPLPGMHTVATVLLATAAASLLATPSRQVLDQVRTAGAQRLQSISSQCADDYVLTADRLLLPTTAGVGPGARGGRDARAARAA